MFLCLSFKICTTRHRSLCLLYHLDCGYAASCNSTVSQTERHHFQVNFEYPSLFVLLLVVYAIPMFLGFFTFSLLIVFLIKCLMSMQELGGMVTSVLCVSSLHDIRCLSHELLS